MELGEAGVLDIEPHPTPYTTRRGSPSLSEKTMANAKTVPANAGTRLVLYNKNLDLESSEKGLQRRVHNLEEEVTVLFAIAGIAAISAILF